MIEIMKTLIIIIFSVTSVYAPLPVPQQMMPVLVVPSTNCLLTASKNNRMSIDGVVNTIQETLGQELATLSSLARTVASEALKINRREILEKLDASGSTFADTNDKANSILVSFNKIDQNLDSILQASGSVDGEINEAKVIMDAISRKMAVISTFSNSVIERNGSIKPNTDEIDARINRIRSLLSDTNAQTELVQTFADALIAITEIIDQNL